MSDEFEKNCKEIVYLFENPQCELSPHTGVGGGILSPKLVKIVNIFKKIICDNKINPVNSVTQFNPVTRFNPVNPVKQVNSNYLQNMPIDIQENIFTILMNEQTNELYNLLFVKTLLESYKLTEYVESFIQMTQNYKEFFKDIRTGTNESIKDILQKYSIRIKNYNNAIIDYIQEISSVLPNDVYAVIDISSKCEYTIHAMTKLKNMADRYFVFNNGFIYSAPGNFLNTSRYSQYIRTPFRHFADTMKSAYQPACNYDVQITTIGDGKEIIATKPTKPNNQMIEKTSNRLMIKIFRNLPIFNKIIQKRREFITKLTPTLKVEAIPLNTYYITKTLYIEAIRPLKKKIKECLQNSKEYSKEYVPSWTVSDNYLFINILDSIKIHLQTHFFQKSNIDIQGILTNPFDFTLIRSIHFYIYVIAQYFKNLIDKINQNKDYQFKFNYIWFISIGKAYDEILQAIPKDLSVSLILNPKDDLEALNDYIANLQPCSSITPILGGKKRKYTKAKK
jgi:hypothetical protein